MQTQCRVNFCLKAWNKTNRCREPLRSFLKVHKVEASHCGWFPQAFGPSARAWDVHWRISVLLTKLLSTDSTMATPASLPGNLVGSRSWKRLWTAWASQYRSIVFGSPAPCSWGQDWAAPIIVSWSNSIWANPTRRHRMLHHVLWKINRLSYHTPINRIFLSRFVEAYPWYMHYGGIGILGKWVMAKVAMNSEFKLGRRSKGL